MKIGIITYHRSHNYGAYLQSYALSNYIIQNYKSNDVEVEIIDLTMKKARFMYIKEIFTLGGIKSIPSNILKYSMFEKEVKKLPLSSYKKYTDSCSQFEEIVKDKYDVIITGSDEVWKYGFRGFPNYYWLPSNYGCRKFAYAVSSRNELSKLDESVINKMQQYINDFEYIGCRDDLSIKNATELTNDKNNIFKNCDPVFLYDFDINYEVGKNILIEKYGIDSSKPTIGVMLGAKSVSEKVVKFLRNEYGDKCNIVALYVNFSNLKMYSKGTPFDWINTISACDFFVTTYFHGMCFAIKAGTPFFTVECRPNAKDTGKNYDIMKEMNLLDRYSYIEEDFVGKLSNIIAKEIGVRHDWSSLCEKQKEKSKTFFEKLFAKD